MNQKKSIDGILPAQPRRSVYIQRTTKPSQVPKQFISLQPRPNAYKRTSLVGQKPRVQNNADNNVVIRLPRKRIFVARVFSLFQYLVFIFAALFAAGNSTIGQYLVLAFALYVLLLRKNSQRTFLLALILLISIPVFQILKQPGVSDNMAIYTYELLVIGTLQAILELKWPRVFKSQAT